MQPWNYYSITGLLNTITSVGLGLFIVSRNLRSPINRSFGYFTFFVSQWALWYTAWTTHLSSYEMCLVFSRVLNVAALFIPVTFLHFTFALTKQLYELRSQLRWLYLVTAVLASFGGTPLLVRDVQPILAFSYYARPGFVYHLFVTWFAIAVIWGHVILFKAFKEKGVLEVNQLRLVFVGTLIGFLSGSMNFLPIYEIPIPPIGNALVPVYIATIAYSILKYRFMDIRIVITATSLLLGVYLAVLGIPFLVGWLAKEWLRQQVGEEWWLVPLGLCTVLATIGPFAYAYLRRQAEAALLRDQRRYQRTLQLAARGMTRVRDLGKLSRLIAQEVSRTIRVQHASLFLWDTDRHQYALVASHGPKRLAVPSYYGLESAHALVQWLHEHRRTLTKEEAVGLAPPTLANTLDELNAALVVPGLIEHELLGFLVLGDKLSTAAYSADDLNAFSTLAHEAAIALENARSYGELLTVNEQLRAARDRLVKQERFAAAGQFATGMAHEIKNPLSAIKTFAEYLPEKYGDSAFRQKFFRIVQGEIERINALVKDLLEFAKPARPELQAVRVCALLEETLTLLSSRFLGQGIEVRRAFQENGLLIQADPKQLKQVVLNLVLNSLDAMPSGGRLDVRTQVREAWLILEVADTGCGIPDEHQHKLFDPFFTTKERGMGLGLAVVKGIVDLHGGQIFIRSRPGHGTTVEVMLPVGQKSRKPMAEGRHQRD